MVAQGNFGRYRCAAEIAKTPQCIYCYQMKPEFTCYNLFDNLDAIGKGGLKKQC